jgi:hypothetical protein
VANILFRPQPTSATRRGPVYGHGLLNGIAALQPVGTTTFAVADGTPRLTTAVMLGPVFGVLPPSKLRSPTTMLDSFGRNFDAISRAAMSLPVPPDLFGTMRQRLGWLRAFVWELHRNSISTCATILKMGDWVQAAGGRATSPSIRRWRGFRAARMA